MQSKASWKGAFGKVDAESSHRCKIGDIICPSGAGDLMCLERASNPHVPYGTRDFKSRASANSAIQASWFKVLGSKFNGLYYLQLFSGAEGLDHGRDHTDNNDRSDHEGEILLHDRLISEKIPEQAKAPYPQDSAYHVV